jgi:hypothetical protein
MAGLDRVVSESAEDRRRGKLSKQGSPELAPLAGLVGGLEQRPSPATSQAASRRSVFGRRFEPRSARAFRGSRSRTSKPRAESSRQTQRQPVVAAARPPPASGPSASPSQAVAED